MQAPVTRLEAHDVPLGQIENRLAQLARESVTKTVGNTAQAAARSSVMTLVAYARGQAQADRVGHAIEHLKMNLPSRSIILAAFPEAEGNPLSASVALSGQIPHGGNPVFAEQIRIDARGEATKHMAGVVLPLLLTELPVFFWWTDGLPNGDLVENLLETSDRAIIDSADFTDPAANFVRFADLVQAQINRTAFSDFNWTRLRPWRELTAQFFDTPHFRPYLDGIEHLDIEYAVMDGEAPNPVQAYLYAGWLASRLGWQTWTGLRQPNGKIRLGLHTTAGAPITVEIAPRRVSHVQDWWATSSPSWDLGSNGQEHPAADGDASVCAGALMRVGIRSHSNANPATFTVLREDYLKNATTVVVAEGETVPQRRTPLETAGEALLLSQQLGIFGHDAVFDAAIAAGRVMATSTGHRARGAH